MCVLSVFSVNITLLFIISHVRDRIKTWTWNHHLSVRPQGTGSHKQSAWRAAPASHAFIWLISGSVWRRLGVRWSRTTCSTRSINVSVWGRYESLFMPFGWFGCYFSVACYAEKRSDKAEREMNGVDATSPFESWTEYDHHHKQGWL